jgi:TolB-like protein
MKPSDQFQFIEVVPKSLIPRKELYINESNLFRRSVNSDSIHTVSRYLQLLVVRRKAYEAKSHRLDFISK